ncbi:MAG: hypothetical protein ACJ8AW_13305 [Rhodopila sp.]
MSDKRTSIVPMNAIVTGFNAISGGVSVTPSQHAPIFEKTDDDLVLPQPWCMGFLAVMLLRFDVWRWSWARSSGASPIVTDRDCRSRPASAAIWRKRGI